ncbi:MAG: transporter substrate-binding protein, partial [Sphingomonas bacterium]|nr:transporter substrate-binding protein [Sphingomonas bacterium]
LAVAGLRQRALPGGRISAETLLLAPPAVAVTSNYRADDVSRERQWLGQPALRRARIGRQLVADGRRWTCLGPPMVAEVARLRGEMRR